MRSESAEHGEVKEAATGENLRLFLRHLVSHNDAVGTLATSGCDTAAERRNASHLRLLKVGRWTKLAIDFAKGDGCHRFESGTAR